MEDTENLPQQEPLSTEQIISQESDRLVYNWDTNTLDFRKLRVTDLKDCPKLILPPPRPQVEEIGFITKETLWAEKYQCYRTKFCNEKGIQTTKQLTKSEKRSDEA